jgi:hypothetical protein
MDRHLFDQLLSEGESSHLDYKRDQYGLADIGEKAEFIKDILAMANASRPVAAHILIGVEHRPGKPASVKGVSPHLDDATLQQLVNGKTNRPITFSYSEFPVDAITVGVIEIPVQRRPFFLKSRFGKLDAGKVYVRRGSSTDIADPDEIHRMGEESVDNTRVPTIEIQFADITARTPLGSKIQIAPLLLNPLSDDALPQISDHSYGLMEPNLNRDYYTELRDYVWTHNAVFAVGFVAHNKSSTVAMGVRAELSFDASPDVMLAEYLPSLPEKRRYVSFNYDKIGHVGLSDVSYRQHGKTFYVDVEFGKIQPRSDAWTGHELFIGTAATKKLILAGRIFGDNFEPVPIELRITSKATTRAMTVADLDRKPKQRSPTPG